MPEPASRHELIDPVLARYVDEHASAPDEIVHRLRAVTRERTGEAARMQIGEDQALLFEILARATGARRAIEIGTFTGMSALAVARGMGPEGHLVCCDVSEEWTATAREFWAEAGVSDRIELRIGPALETLVHLDADGFDIAFIDADKTGYLAYYEALVPKMRGGGLILVDNTLQGGRVVDEGDEAANTVAIRAFNDRVATDSRVVAVLLPIGDGVSVIEKR